MTDDTTVTDALSALHQACAQVAALDRTACTPDQLARLVVGVGRMQDRLRAVHALHVLEADRARVWHPGGARNVTGWYADRLGVGYGDALRIVKLGDVLERSNRVLDAVLTGRLSAATAESLHAAVVQAPAGADIDDFLDTILGPRPDVASKPDGDDDGEPVDVPNDERADDDDERAPDSEPQPTPTPEPAGFGFGPAPDDTTPTPGPGLGPKDARQAADAWKQSHADPVDAAERLRSKRAVVAGAPIDGLATTTIVLPVLEHRQFLNALDHIAGQPADHDDRTVAQRRADALIALCAAYAAGTITGGREHPKIIVTIDLDSFLGNANHAGLSSMGDRIPAAVIRELAEQAELRWMLHTGTEILQLGRTERLASDAQYEALIARDGFCRWPGCTIPAAWCEVDHLIDWDLGGLTDIDWEALWCSHHHHVKHRAGVIVHGDANDLTLELPDGTLIACPPKGIAGKRRQPEPGTRPGGPDEPTSHTGPTPTTHARTPDDASTAVDAPTQPRLFDAA